MKKTTKLWAATAGVLIVLLSVGFGMMKLKAGDNGSDLVIVREYFSDGKGEIIVSYGGQKTEKIETGSWKSKNRESNIDLMHTVLNKLFKSGYKLVGTTGHDVVTPVTEYILQKN